MTKQKYLDMCWAAAVEACKGTAIFPALAIAESALESSWGESWLTKEAFNFFGTKSTKSWEAAGGKWVIKWTREVVGGQNKMIACRFRKYDSVQHCFENWVHFVTQPNYVKNGVLEAKTPEEQIRCIAAAGYATDPAYAATIVDILKGLAPLIAKRLQTT